MLPGRNEAFIALVAGISLVAVMLGVAALVIVMSVMNGFRGELIDKIVGLNGHAIIQAYGGRLENWQEVLKEVRATPGVTRASPLIEQPLLATFNGRAEAILVRGNTARGHRPHQAARCSAATCRRSGPASTTSRSVRGWRENLGIGIGDTLTIINPQGPPDAVRHGAARSRLHRHRDLRDRRLRLRQGVRGDADPRRADAAAERATRSR